MVMPGSTFWANVEMAEKTIPTITSVNVSVLIIL
jgi:hypothetical protein